MAAPASVGVLNRSARQFFTQFFEDGFDRRTLAMDGVFKSVRASCFSLAG
jgi:hypothetical protein